GGSDDGLAIFHVWSRRSDKYDEQDTTDKWEDYKGCPPNEIGAGSVFRWANEASLHWEMLSGLPLDKAMKIGDLIQLSIFDYEMKRKVVAEELDMRTTVLDTIVDRLRPYRDDDDGHDGGKQGRAISLPEPEPWPEPVDGPMLLDALAAAFGRY